MIGIAVRKLISDNAASMRAFAIAFLLAVAAAQTPNPTVVLPDGTSIAARLATSLSTRKAHAGDEVQATVAVGVVMAGTVVIPQGAQLFGRVVAAAARSKENRESMLMVRFERAEWKGGSAALNAFIVGNLRNLPGRGRNDCFGHRFLSQPSAPVTPFYQSQAPNVLNGTPQPTHDTRSGVGLTGSPVGPPPCAVAGPPDLHHIRVHKVDQPAGATQLISGKKNIDLPAGIIVELRHVAN